MGSIKHCYNIEGWKILREAKLKSNEEKIVYLIRVGECDDQDGIIPMKIWILKDIYDKIQKNEYTVIKQPYSDEPILVKDSNGNLLNLFGE